MGENEPPSNLQEAVERSFRERWGGKRFCLVTAIVLAVLAVVSAIMVTTAPSLLAQGSGALKVLELAALTTSFVCLIAAVMFALEALVRAQRERAQVPDRVIHFALCLSVVCLADLLFLFFLSAGSWESSGMGPRLVGIIRFVVFLFASLTWLGSVSMTSGAIAMLATHRSDLLEVNNTTEGTALVFRRGHGGEIVKLSVAALIPLIIFVVGVLIVGTTHILG